MIKVYRNTCVSIDYDLILQRNYWFSERGGFKHQKQPPDVFCEKKVFLKNFAIFTGKYLYWSLFFNKVAGFHVCSFFKRRLKHKLFPANIAKFLRAPILKNICERLLLKHCTRDIWLEVCIWKKKIVLFFLLQILYW